MLLLHIHTILYYTHFPKKVNKIVGKFFVIMLFPGIVSALSPRERPMSTGGQWLLLLALPTLAAALLRLLWPFAGP